MGILSKWKGTKYNDDGIVKYVSQAIVDDPLIADPTSLTVSSRKGVITLIGVVHKESEKDRIEGVVRGTLRNTGLQFERIVNDLKLVN